MSENGQETRARILERARVLFNERGIDNVGVRDLARDLEMSPGNLSYWFTRKDELVRGLLLELRARNAARPAQAAVETVEGLLDAFRTALEAQLEYRCLTESIVHVARTWPALGEVYRETEALRRAALAAHVRVLVGNGALVDVGSDAHIARLVGTWSLIARFWLSERTISYAAHNDADTVRHYLALFAHSLVPHVPLEGRPTLAPFLAGVLPEAAG